MEDRRRGDTGEGREGEGGRVELIWEISNVTSKVTKGEKKKKTLTVSTFLLLHLSLIRALLFMAAMISVRAASFAQTRGLLGKGHH